MRILLLSEYCLQNALQLQKEVSDKNFFYGEYGVSGYKWHKYLQYLYLATADLFVMPPVISNHSTFEDAFYSINSLPVLLMAREDFKKDSDFVRAIDDLVRYYFDDSLNSLERLRLGNKYYSPHIFQKK